MAGIQGGFLIAGAVVGFIYNKIGLGGVLVIDALTYVFSFSCFLFVRRGKHLLIKTDTTLPDAEPMTGVLDRFLHEMREGFAYLKLNPAFIAIGLCWSLFLSGMLTQNVITAPISDRILHAGAVGFGWLNAGWGIGAFLSAVIAIRLMAKAGSQQVTRWAMATLALALTVGPFSHWLAVAVFVWFCAGMGRGIGGIALSSEFMEQIPKHLMGRVQNIFYFVGTLLQVVFALSVGAIAHRISLVLAAAVIGAIYATACATTLIPQPTPKEREIAAATSL
jgi:MFS family permease